MINNTYEKLSPCLYLRLEGDIHGWCTTFWTQDPRILFCYLPNTMSTWNKFKCKILDNSNYANFHGDGDFFKCVCNYASIFW